MEGTLEDRLAALERAVTDGDHDCSALAEGAATADRVSDIEAEIADLTDRVAELEAATQALRGYVGNVRSVNSEVEERADLALSKAEAAHHAIEQSTRDGTETAPGNGTEQTEGDRRTPRGTATQAVQESTETDQRVADGMDADQRADGMDADQQVKHSTDRRTEQQGCRHCRFPVHGEERSAGVPETGGERTDSKSARATLDTIREPADARTDTFEPVTNSQTDGGSPEYCTDGTWDDPQDEGEQEPTGVVSRIRSLL